MEKPTRTLVLAAGGLGDCVLTVPALQLLRVQGPVTVAGTHPYRELGASLLGVDEVVPLDPLLESLYAHGPPAAPMAKFLGGFVRIHLFFKDPDPKALGSLARHASARVHQPEGVFSDFIQDGRWAGEYWLKAVLPPGAKVEETWKHPRLRITDPIRSQGEALCASWGVPRPFIVHPGSGSPAKNAPLTFFRKALEKVASETGKKTLVLWGEAERDRRGEIEKALGDLPGLKVLPEPLPLPQVAAVLTQASGYLGNDSGITHLASACGARTFAVFKATDSRVWGPREAFILEAVKSFYS